MGETSLSQEGRYEDEAAMVEKLQRTIDGLQIALTSRDVIGQAKGILMERLHVSADEAFDSLRMASQAMNRKLAAVAEELAATGQWPPPGYEPAVTPSE